MLQNERRPSIRRGSIQKREDVSNVKFPFDQLDVRNDSNSGKSSIGYGGESRNSGLRKGSTNQDMIETELDQLRKCVPQDYNARWTCELSLEFRYAMFQGYSELIKKELEKLNKTVRFSTINSVSMSTGRSLISEDIETIQEGLYQKLSLNIENVEHKLKEYSRDLENALPQSQKKSQNRNKSKRRQQQKQQRELISESSDIERATTLYNLDEDEGDYDDIDDISKTTNKKRHSTIDMEHLDKDPKIQLLMSRYLQYAHAMLDAIKQDQNIVKSSKSYTAIINNKVDIERSFELWNNSWKNLFKVTSYSKLLI